MAAVGTGFASLESVCHHYSNGIRIVMLNMLSRVRRALKGDIGLRELISGGVISFAMQGSGMLLGYVLLALLGNLYGAKIVGVYSLSLTLLTLLSMLCVLGLDTYILKQAGRSTEQDSSKILGKIYRLVIFPAFISSIFVIAVSFFLAEDIFSETEYKNYLILSGVLIVFFSIISINTEYLRARKRILYSEFLRNVSRPLLVIIFVAFVNLFYFNNDTPAHAIAFSVVLSFFVSCLFVHSVSSKRSGKEDGSDGVPEAREILDSSLPMLASAVAFFLIGNMAIFFVEAYEETVKVGLMAVAIKLALLTNMPLMVLNKVSAPRFSKLHFDGDKLELQRYINQVTKMAFWVAFLMAGFLAIFSDLILSVFGDEFIEAKYLLLVLILGQLFACSAGSVGVLMLMSGAEKAYRNITISTATLSALAYMLVLPLYGLTGAAWVFAGTRVVLNLSAVIYVRRKLGYITMYFPGSGLLFKV